MVPIKVAKQLALSLPDAEERDHFGSPSFRVKGKIYAQLPAMDEPGNRAVLKLPLADQTALILSDPDVFSAVPQWGKYGWTHVRLEAVEPELFKHLLRESWAQVAPTQLRNPRKRTVR